MNTPILTARDALTAIRQLFENVLTRGKITTRWIPSAIAGLCLDMPEKNVKIDELERYLIEYQLHRTTLKKAAKTLRWLSGHW
jgi:hypothetical protein